MPVTKQKTKKVSLTKQRRAETWHQLTSEQQAVIQKHIRYEQTSLFMNHELVGHGRHWSLVAYHENFNYEDTHKPQLYCDCGRRLKYQYVLANDLGEEIKLGITHFADHIGISEPVARQLQTEIHQLNFGLDELLQRIRRHAGLNQEMRHWFIDHQMAFKNLPPQTVEFILQNLPPEREVQADIVRAFKKATYVKKPRTHHKKSKLDKNAWQELFRDI
ncbi:hypothetical protein AB0X56_04815 [Weissella paramesenteroides]|uniref:hypothetical protein n=1 Tax=Weissella paramesenteroides TaxID=1249 RepID=UPI003F23FBD2